MISPLDNAKTAGSVSREMASSRAVHFPAATRRVLRRDHSSPTTTSNARVRAKNVRSSVRPAYRVVWYSTPGGESDRTGVVSVKPGLCFDWSSPSPNHAAINDANHRESLYWCWWIRVASDPSEREG